MAKIVVKNAKKVPQATLKKVWHSQYPNEPMPHIEMLTQKPREFAKGVKANYSSKLRKESLKREYGCRPPVKNIYGYTTKTKTDYTIVTREGSPKRSPMASIMKHEFKHIHNKDV